MENIDVKSLSPIYFHLSDPDIKDAYTAAYQMLVKYQHHDKEKAAYLTKILYAALYERDVRDLMMWHKTHLSV